MPRPLYTLLPATSDVAQIIIAVSAMLFLGFAATRLTKRLRLPDVTAYILTGILIGPYCLDLIPPPIIEGTDFLSDVALAFIAFSVGEYFTFDSLRRNGPWVILITVVEACAASALVFMLTYWVLGLSLPFSVVLAALASATAPASTVMTIRQTGAHGDFVDTLLQVVALDDVVGLVLYSVAISVALASFGAGVGLAAVGRPIVTNLAAAALGGGCGLLLKRLFRHRSTDNRLIVSIAVLFALCGVCALAEVSPLLGCMTMGMVYINVSGDAKLFRQLNYWSPPLLLLFFVRSGLSFRLDALLRPAAGGGVPLLVTGVGYFFMRMLGKYLGAWLGCLAVGKPKSVRRWLGLALIPQAGVAVGLAAMGARTLGGEMGQQLQTVILASSVLYELVGPAAAKLSLHLSGSYGPQKAAEGTDAPPATAVDAVQAAAGEAPAISSASAPAATSPVSIAGVEVSQTTAGAPAAPPPGQKSPPARAARQKATAADDRQRELAALVARIQQIQAELPDPVTISPEEQAFTEAAQEQYAFVSYQHDRRFRGRLTGGNRP